jgi:hypothetical protein
MGLHQTPQRGEPRLRVVFANQAKMLGLPPGSTLGDVAVWVEDNARLHNGQLLSIDIKISGRDAARPDAGFN